MNDPYDNAGDAKSSVLGPTLKFKGELTADEDLLIQGQVEGVIKHTSSLTIGNGGHVKADVTAEYIVVEGRVDGDLKGSKCVKVRESAKVNGNIISPKVSLFEGATFNGQIDMDGNRLAKSASKPEAKPASNAVATPNESAEDRSQAARKAGRPEKKSADAA
ncbi:MAG: polymer-forming cytoskeletal protein [Gammaproteobacteria bacterium]|nr:polymer-forming cytoskeletal protein [Gammaproteobacteria bacterium]MDH4255440.1 polymer-forming cytoskeletal protein [Gammaproteobacteria bacterium]MDH5311753.1 polymer-forming cytoskeletal protein [Gammaproteobacteria bacterium]